MLSYDPWKAAANFVAPLINFTREFAVVSMRQCNVFPSKVDGWKFISLGTYVTNVEPLILCNGRWTEVNVCPSSHMYSWIVSVLMVKTVMFNASEL